jgi:hypothetical protein
MSVDVAALIALTIEKEIPLELISNPDPPSWTRPFDGLYTIFGINEFLQTLNIQALTRLSDLA